MVTWRGLEKIARSFRSKEDPRIGPEGELTAEIALMSERLDAVRRRHAQTLRELARDESRITCCLNSLESYLPRVYLYRGQPRENLKLDLTRVRREQRALVVEYDRHVAVLHDRLFGLLRRLSVVEGEEAWS